MPRDEVYSLPRDRVGQFRFDEDVAEVFPDMISRSVPGYASILAVIEQLAARYVVPGSNVYDLGCSLGAASFLIRNQAPADVILHAIDNSESMLERFRRKIATERSRPDRCEIRPRFADIREVEITNASMIVLNFTLQFVPRNDRPGLIQRCYDGLRPGGALVLSEKICFDEPGQQDLLAELHLDFKRACGYSELEIAQKRTALEDTLVPETISDHTSRLTASGFEVAAPWFQCFNFASILAIKGPPVSDSGQ